MRYIEPFPQDQYFRSPFWEEVSLPTRQDSHVREEWNADQPMNQTQIFKQILADYLKDEEGELDFEKVMKTVGVMVQTSRELRPLAANVHKFIQNLKQET